MEDKTSKELIDELAARHEELIVIRPKPSNMIGSADKLVVFCKTKTPDCSYDLYEAIELLRDAEIGLIRDCIVETGDK